MDKEILKRLVIISERGLLKQYIRFLIKQDRKLKRLEKEKNKLIKK